MATNKEEKILYKDISYKIQGLVFDIRNDLGSGHKETIYQKALENGLLSSGLSFKREQAIKIYSKTGEFLGLYRPDFIIEDKIIIELKANKVLTRQEKTQIYDYLRNSKYELAYLINFASPRLYMKRFVFTNDRKRLQTITLSIFVAICAVFVAISGATSVLAQSIGYSLTTNIYDVAIPAGTSYSDRIIVFNNLDSPATPIHIELSLWNLSEETDDFEFITSEPALNAAKWFTIENGADFILNQGRDRNIDFTINVPSGTPPGSYLVMMRFQSVLPDYYFSGDGPKFIPELASIFFIKVPALSLEGDISGYNARIESLKPDGDKIRFADRVLPRAKAGVFDSAIKKLLADINNDGIYHFKMSGTVTVKNIFGRVVVEEPLPQRYLIPNRTRSIDIAVLPSPTTENLPFIQRIFKSITYNLKTNTYFGPYSASVTLEVPNEPPVVESVNFWVIPWQFWLTLAALIAGGLFVFKKFGSELAERIQLFGKVLFGVKIRARTAKRVIHNSGAIRHHRGRIKSNKRKIT